MLGKLRTPEYEETTHSLWKSGKVIARAIKINGRTPCYPPFRRLSSPSDVNSPSYFAISCKIRYELKVPPFVAGERLRAVLLIVRRPYIWERTVQISAKSDHGASSKTAIVL